MVVYSNLPYDVLHQICRIDYGEWKHREDKDQVACCSLSIVDRRTRDVAIPTMFSVVRFKQAWLEMTDEEINDLIDALMKNDPILQAIKYVPYLYFIYLSLPFYQCL
jgi:hypothetical protein